jgi:hypothetical protein
MAVLKPGKNRQLRAVLKKLGPFAAGARAGKPVLSEADFHVIQVHRSRKHPCKSLQTSLAKLS